MCLLRMTIECKSKKLDETKNMLNEYLKINLKYENNRNCKFLQNIILTVETNNIDKFKELIFKHDCLVKIPKDEYKLLCMIKETFN